MPLRTSGIEAWITVGDKIPAKEYDIDVDEDGGVATCWINGEPGQVSCLVLRAQFIGLRMQMVVSEADQAGLSICFRITISPFRSISNMATNDEFADICDPLARHLRSCCLSSDRRVLQRSVCTSKGPEWVCHDGWV